MALVDVLAQLYDELPDEDTKGAIKLFLFLLSKDPEARFYNTQARLNQNLNTFGLPRNNEESRKIKIEQFNYASSTIESLEYLVVHYPPNLVKTILTRAFTELGSKVGNKTFEYRIVKFNLFLTVFVDYRDRFSDDEFVRLLESKFPFDFLFYDKDWPNNKPNQVLESYKTNLVYASIRQDYKDQQKPFITLLKELYTKDLEISVEHANQQLGSQLQILIDYNLLTDIDLFKLFFSKWFSPEQLEGIFAHVEISEEFKNTLGITCSTTSVRTVPCVEVPGKSIRVCPDTANDEDDVRFLCQPRGGKRKTRNRKSKRRKTKRRRN